MDIVRQSLAITFVFALLWAALWWLRKRGAANLGFSRSPAAGLMQVRGKLQLGAQHSIHLVRVGSRELVLAVHPGGISLLCESPAESSPAGGERP